MEIIIILIAFIAFAFLAARYGYDSRDTIDNKESDFAGYGYTWDTLQHEQTLADEMKAARVLRSRQGDLVEAA